MKQKLYRIPSEGKIGGVCAGVARFLGVSPTLVRVVTIVCAVMGFFVLAALIYGLLMFFLETAPSEEAVIHSKAPLKSHLEQAEITLEKSEQRLRNLERYITSETFNVERQFRNL